MVTGDKPWSTEETHEAGVERTMYDETSLPEYPEKLGIGPLQGLYENCLSLEPDDRPSAAEIINKTFQGKILKSFTWTYFKTFDSFVIPNCFKNIKQTAVDICIGGVKKIQSLSKILILTFPLV